MVGKQRSVARQMHDFIDYDELELQVDRNMKEEAAWFEEKKGRPAQHGSSLLPSAHFKATSMQDYFTARGFDNNGQANNQSEAAAKVYSNILTGPLTLAYAHKLLYPSLPSKLKVLIIGARAESSLPPMWWRECLYNNANLSEVQILMTGPGADLRKKDIAFDEELKTIGTKYEWQPNSTGTGTNDISHNKSDLESASSKNQSDLHNSSSAPLSVSVGILDDENNRKVFHECKDALKYLRWADAFMLYNPGEK